MTIRTPGLPGSALLSLALLTACGGGGGGGGGGSTGGGSGPPAPTASWSVTPSTLSYSSTVPVFPAPISQFVTGTVTGTVSGTLYVKIDIVGPAVKTADNLSIGAGANFGSAAVVPNDPSALGSGTFTSTLTVHACQNDSTCKTGELIGSPQTVTVTYTVGVSPSAGVYPAFSAEGLAGYALIRNGELGVIQTPTSVLLGSVTALSFTNPTPDTFTVNYPVLTTLGTVRIATNNNDFLGNLQVVAVPSFAAQTLSYPSGTIGTPTAIGAVVYDPAIPALVVATRAADPTTNGLVSFVYASGSWQVPTVAVVSRVRHVTLYPGNGLLVTRETQIENRASDTLVQSGITPVQVAMPPFISTAAALTNDGYYLVTTENATTPSVGQIDTAAFATTSFGFNQTTASAGVWPQSTIGVSGDGSRTIIVPTAPPTGSTGKIDQFDASHELLSDTSLVFNHNGTFRAPALDRRAQRLILSNDTATNVYDAKYTLLGTLPVTTQAYVVNSTGARAYTYDSSGNIYSFDISAAAPNNGAYPQSAAPVTIGSVGSNTAAGTPKMAITPDDHTVFVAGTTAIVIQPVQ